MEVTQPVGEIRQSIGSFLDGINEPRLHALLEQLLFGVSGKLVRHEFVCKEPSCARRQIHEVEVDVPAVRPSEVAKTLQVLTAEAKGRPAEHKSVSVSVTVKGLEGMRALSDEELAGIVSGEAEVAEWSPIPALLPVGS